MSVRCIPRLHGEHLIRSLFLDIQVFLQLSEYSNHQLTAAAEDMFRERRVHEQNIPSRLPEVRAQIMNFIPVAQCQR